MAGHSHWAGIKRQKEVTDKKRGIVFSKLLAAITAAAQREPNPDFNPRLRTAIEKAKESNVPKENITRAIARAKNPSEALQELVCEAYGPGGTALIIQAITSNRNRTIQEIKKILSDHAAKWADPGSVLWGFLEKDSTWEAKFPEELKKEDQEKLKELISALENIEDVQLVAHNASFL